MCKYSIIMPVYNSGTEMKKSIESVLNQTYNKWELIIIDDGSTDNSLEIAKKFANKNRRIKVFHQKNAGPGAARNKGIKEASGDYIAFLDSDDYYEKNFLETIDNKNQDCDVIFYSNIKEDIDGKIVGGTNLSKYINCPKEKIIKMQMMGVIPWGAQLKVVKSTIVKECSFSHIPVGEELIYSFNVLNKAKKITIIERPLYHYFHNTKGQHTKGGNDPWNQVVEELKKHLRNIGEYNKYEKIVNGLALRALTISIYRYSCNYKYKDAKLKIKEKINEYKKKNDINNVEFECLDKISKILLKLINHKFYFLLFLSSKIRNMKQ